MKLGIVIPVYLLSYVNARLTEFSTMLPFEKIVFVCDNPDNAERISRIASYWTGRKASLHIIYNQENQGYLRSSNAGVQYLLDNTDCEYIITSNDDIVFREDVVKAARRTVSKFPDERTLFGHRLINFSSGWNRFLVKGDMRLTPYLSGHYLMAHRAYAPLYDDLYAPSDFEDVDLSTQAAWDERPLVQLSLDAEHLGARSYKPSREREERTLRNQKKFFSKWGSRLADIEYRLDWEVVR